jgi:hypothetical protein
MAIILIPLIPVQTNNHGNHLNLINPGSDKVKLKSIGEISYLLIVHKLIRIVEMLRVKEKIYKLKKFIHNIYYINKVCRTKPEKET